MPSSLPYEVDYKGISSFIEENKLRRVLLQAPDGLKPLLAQITRYIMERYRGSVGVYVSGSPSYGSCDLAIDEARVIGADAIIHVGHNRYPFLTGDTGIPVLYLPAYYMRRLKEEFMQKVAETIISHGVRSTAIIASLQYVRQARLLHEFLHDRGLRVISGRSRSGVLEDYQVLGCDYTALDTNEGYDAVIVVSSGFFHAYGALLYKGPKRVLLVDPVREAVFDLSSLYKKLVAKRLYMVSRMISSGYRRAAVIVGSAPGQYRPRLADEIGRAFAEEGVDVVKVVARYVTHDVLSSIDNAYNVDFFVITSCPRLPIDDLQDFYKPVFTPGEAFMILRRTLEYRFPW